MYNHLCICIYVYMYICICISVYMYICIYVNMYIRIHTYIHIYIYVNMYMCISLSLYIYIYICLKHLETCFSNLPGLTHTTTHTHIHIHTFSIHMCTYTYTCYAMRGGTETVRFRRCPSRRRSALRRPPWAFRARALWSEYSYEDFLLGWLRLGWLKIP